MATIREEAMNYEGNKTFTIAEAPQPIAINSFEVLTETGQDNEGKEFSYKYFQSNNEKGEICKYRIPGTVLDSIKRILEAAPTTTHVKVEKSGTGLKTQYTVVQVPAPA